MAAVPLEAPADWPRPLSCPTQQPLASDLHRIADPHAERDRRGIGVRHLAVLPGIECVADARAAVRHGGAGHAARLQHHQRRDAGAVLADAGIVEEHQLQRPFERERARAGAAMRTRHHDRAFVAGRELRDRVDHDHAAAGAARHFVLAHRAIVARCGQGSTITTTSGIRSGRCVAPASGRGCAWCCRRSPRRPAWPPIHRGSTARAATRP